MATATSPTIEERVRTRMDAEIADLDKQIAASEKEREKTGEQHADANAEAKKLEDEMIALEDAKEEIPEDLRERATKAGERALKLQNASVGFGNRIASLTRDRERLNDAEYERRVREGSALATARKPEREGKKVTGREAAEIVLREAGKPLHYNEITDTALKSGLLTPKGATPAATMNSMLSVQSKQKDPTFKRVAPGVFDLVNREASTPAKAKAKAPAKKATAAKKPAAKSTAKKAAAKS